MTIYNGDGKIHEIHGGGEVFKGPLESPLLHVKFECVPKCLVGGWAWVWNPYADDVVNESAVEAKVCGPLLVESCFKQSKEDCGPRWSRGDSHACARDLFPKCVSKCNDIVFEYYMDGFNECIHVVVVVGSFTFCMKVARDVFDSRSGSDVRIHGCGIACKKFFSRGDGYLHELVLQGERVSEIGLLVLSNWLEHLSDPFSKAMGDAAHV